MPSAAATSTTKYDIDHVELEFEASDLHKLVTQLSAYLQQQPAQRYHLQIARKGVPPPAGSTVPIKKGDPVTVTIHRFS